MAPFYHHMDSVEVFAVLTFTVLVFEVGVACLPQRAGGEPALQGRQLLCHSKELSAKWRGYGRVGSQSSLSDHASPTKPRPLLDLRACDRLGFSRCSNEFDHHCQPSGEVDATDLVAL